MNIVKALASTLALVSALAAVPAVAQADEGRHETPAAVDRDRRADHDRDARWGYDRDGRWGWYDAGHRRDFDRDWRGYRVGPASAAVCRFEWDGGAPIARMYQLGCFVR
jgi:Ni/Co efflux regulator RcnB